MMISGVTGNKKLLLICSSLRNGKQDEQKLRCTMAGLSTPVHFTYMAGYPSRYRGYKLMRIQVHPQFITPEQLTRMSTKDTVVVQAGTSMILNHNYSAKVSLQFVDKIYYFVSDIREIT